MDADFDPSKENASDTSLESDNEGSISDSSNCSEVFEQIPDLEQYLIQPPREAAQTDHETAFIEDPGVETDYSQITIQQTNNHGVRHYDKKYYCMFCRKSKAKLKKHFLTMHEDETEVVDMESKEDATEKALAYEKMRNIGSHLHNIEVLRSGKGELAVTYRPRDGYEVNAREYGPCPHCYSYFPTKELWRHNAKCKFSTNKEKHFRNALSLKSSMLMPSNNQPASVRIITEGLRKDTISRIVKSDPTIMKYCEKLCAKHGHDKDQHNYIRQKLREVARLLQVLRRESGERDKQLEDFIDPKAFPLVVRSCKLVAGFNDTGNDYGTPSLALKIGHALQKCIKLVLGKSIETANKELQTRAENMGKLFDLSWKDDISSNALKTLNNAKRNTSSSALPLANDVKLLSDYLKTEAQASAIELQEADSLSAWVRLNEITLAQTILFNRRRAGEVSKMTLDDFKKKELPNASTNFEGCLTKFEQELCKIFSRTEIIAKRGRISPVLFTSQISHNLDLLVKKRGIINNPSNHFLFPTRSSLSHIRGTDCLRNFATACGAEAPERLRSTRLRKHIATMSQVLNLNDSEMDVLAQFLGHDIRVHKEFYRLPEATVQVAKVSKLLLLMEKGNPNAQQHDGIDVHENDIHEGNNFLMIINI